MKKFILGFIAALVLMGAGFGIYKFITGTVGPGSGGPVAPEALKPGVLDYGVLKIRVLGSGGAPLSNVEIDLGTIGAKGPEGPMAFLRTDKNGVALFEKVPIGAYDVFWNSYFFPKEYEQPPKIKIEIIKGQTTEKTIELKLK